MNYSYNKGLRKFCLDVQHGEDHLGIVGPLAMFYSVEPLP